ncbi:MAG: hypothetical protein WC421_04980 [Elusimicrobiales bacterium]
MPHKPYSGASLLFAALCCALPLFITPPARAQARTDIPVYDSAVADINRYYMYADAGWDGNWYVGYNNCWIIKLPPAARGIYAKAFIGAKLGRAKSATAENRPWVKIPLPGKIFMGLALSPVFNSQQTYFLTENKDIPREALPDETVEGAGAARWFWAQVPLSEISFENPNYLALWSDNEPFSGPQSSPIIAGAPAAGVVAWVNGSVKGAPPRDSSQPPGTPLGMAPAMVIKLIPRNTQRPEVSPVHALADGQNVVFTFTAQGRDVRAAWLELSHDRFDWQRITPRLYGPPYVFSVPRSGLPSLDIYFVRAAAADWLENTGYSKELSMR